MNLPRGAELIIVLVIVILLFGIGRVSKIGKELGSAVKEFRKGISESSEEAKPTEQVTSEEEKKNAA